MKTIEIIIDERLSNRDIKNILFEHLGFSQRLVTRLKQTDGIRLNGEHATVRKKVILGDILTVTMNDEKNENIVPNNIPIDIVYEDDDILIVNKPKDMPTHPSHGHYENTLANALVYRYRNENFVFRAITRLDKDTTGLVLLAKNPYAANNLCNQIRDRKIKKEYLAICCGQLPQKEGFVDAAIRRENESVIKRVVSADGQYATTGYCVLEYKNGLSLVKLFPETGRTHQIRVHMSYLGTPLYGDFIYGEEILGERTRLHCHALEFVHPVSDKKMYLSCPMPDDFDIIKGDF